MPRTAASNVTPAEAPNGGNIPGEKVARKPHPFMHNITPEMITDPKPLDFAEGMDGYDFACEKFRRVIVEPGGFGSLKSLQDFVKDAWEWAENASIRETENLVDRFLLEVQHKISEAKNKAALQEVVKGKLENTIANL